MKKPVYKVKSKVWLYPGMAGWHFVNISKKQSQEIKLLFWDGMRGFGSIPVIVRIEDSEWKTSIFPDKKSGTYLLPLKSAVRKKHDITAGHTLSFTIEIRV